MSSRLTHGEVRVYSVALAVTDPLPPEIEELLTTSEREAVARHRRPADRARSAVGRAAVRHLIGSQLDLDPRDVPLVASDDGKPQLALAADSDIRFNLSHSGERVLVAVAAGRAVGVDVEEVRATAAIDEIAERFYSPAELAVLGSVAADRRTTATFACWTLKEAYLKARGGGLDRPLDEFDVLTGWSASGRLGDVGVIGEVDGWLLRLLDVGPGYVAALAADQTGPVLPAVVHPLPLTELTATAMRR